MKALIATAAILLVAGCAGTRVSFVGSRPVGDSVMLSLVQTTNQLRLTPGHNNEHDPGAEVGASRSDPLLAPMPFGGSMFGPWDIGDGARSHTYTVTGGSGRLRTILHRLAIQAGVSIVVEGDLDVSLSYIQKGWLDLNDEVPRALALARIQSICKANKLDYIHDGDVVIIKRRPTDMALAHVVLSELDGHYHVSFEGHELVAAIMEVATVTKTQVFVPAVQVNPDDPPAGEEEDAGLPIESVKISLVMRAASPESILRRLAELGDLDIEVVALEDSVDGVGIGYKFRYRE